MPEVWIQLENHAWDMRPRVTFGDFGRGKFMNGVIKGRSDDTKSAILETT